MQPHISPIRSLAVRPVRRKQSACDLAADIVTQRNLLTEEVGRLQRTLGASARFCAQALDLLTRSWSKADWHRRQELVKAARWLVQLETRDFRREG